MSRKYEALFILPVTLNDEEVQKTVQSLQDTVSKVDGKTLNVDVLGKRTFARPIKKQDTGQYVKMKLELPPESVDALIARLKRNDGVVRAQILRGDDVAPAAPADAAQPVTEAANG